MTTDTFFSITAQIVSAAGDGRRQQALERNRPPMRSPLAQQVLEFLNSQHEYKQQHEVRQGTGLRHPAVCWALLLLRKHGLVDAVPDAKRNSRYLRYKARACDK